MQEVSCNQCTHSEVCSIKEAYIKATVSAYMVFNSLTKAEAAIERTVAGMCKHFNPQPLDFKGGAS